MKTFIQSGDMIEVPAPAGGVSSGAGVLIGNLFGIAAASAAAGAPVNLVTRGVYELPKLATDTIDLGQRVYWDATNKHVTKTEAGNYPIGAATSAAGNSGTTVRVRLDGTTTTAA